MKIPESLHRLIDDGVIDEVHSRLLSGKEASVFIVERDEMIIAAKVYKERETRSFKNVSSYTEGRNQTRNTRDKRAMNRKTKYGKELMEASWRDMEFSALQHAFLAGVRVPEPFLMYEDVLLMELVCDEDGNPAPQLAEFELTEEVAELLHLEVYQQVRKLLAAGRVHGDLSAFNILIADAGVTLIDMPQAIDAAANSQAQELLARDLKNITEHLARYNERLLRLVDCGYALWRHYEKDTLEKAALPEPGQAPQHRRGRRGHDTERSRAGQEARGFRPAGRPPQDRAPQGPPPARAPQDRSQGDRPRQDRSPQGDRPRQDRGPQGDRPRQDRGPPPGDRPRQDRSPQGDRPRQDRPPQADRPRQDRGPPPRDRPRMDPRGDERPRSEAPRGGPPPRGRSDSGPRDVVVVHSRPPPSGAPTRVPERAPPAPRPASAPPAATEAGEAPKKRRRRGRGGRGAGSGGSAAPGEG